MANKLSKLLSDLAEDRKLEKRFLEDPETVMEEYELTEEQKRAVRSRDAEAIRAAADGDIAVYTIIWQDKT